MADILQWNCRGLKPRAENLKVLCNRTNAKVVCLQETKLGVNDLFNPGLNFEFFRSPPPSSDRAKGGAAIMVRKNVQHSVVNINSSLQAVAVRVLFDKYITICSLYLPPDLELNLIELQNLVTQLPSPFLILGDFNAHNTMWGGTTLDVKGEIIEDLVNSNPISILNDGSFTYHNIYNNSYSAIDLSICSSSIYLDFEWSVDEFLNGSDHYPIYLKTVKNITSSSTPKWKLEQADWTKYSQYIVLNRKFESFMNHIAAKSILAISFSQVEIPIFLKLKPSLIDPQFHGGTKNVVN